MANSLLFSRLQYPVSLIIPYKAWFPYPLLFIIQIFFSELTVILPVLFTTTLDVYYTVYSFKELSDISVQLLRNTDLIFFLFGQKYSKS